MKLWQKFGLACLAAGLTVQVAHTQDVDSDDWYKVISVDDGNGWEFYIRNKDLFIGKDVNSPRVWIKVVNVNDKGSKWASARTLYQFKCSQGESAVSQAVFYDINLNTISSTTIDFPKFSQHVPESRGSLLFYAVCGKLV
jgi:hypothetical protein